jgi:transcriptional regulator with XRE-family HTH domain
MFENLGNALALLRELRRVSQAEVARRAGIGKSQLSKYENGKEQPKLDSLEKVLNVLRVGPVGLFTVVAVLDGWTAETGGEGEAIAAPSLAPRWPGMGFPMVDEAFEATLGDLLILQRSMLETVLWPGAAGRRGYGGGGPDFGLASRD